MKGKFVNREVLEMALKEGVGWLRLAVEGIGAIIVGIGVMLALWFYIRSVLSSKHANFNSIRLILARYLALALEFQLGSDILSTAVNPESKEIKQLAAIAVIRTGLNYFLGREIQEEQAVEAKAEQTPDLKKDPISAVTG